MVRDDRETPRTESDHRGPQRETEDPNSSKGPSLSTERKLLLPSDIQGANVLRTSWCQTVSALCPTCEPGSSIGLEGVQPAPATPLLVGVGREAPPARGMSAYTYVYIHSQLGLCVSLVMLD